MLLFLNQQDMHLIAADEDVLSHKSFGPVFSPSDHYGVNPISMPV